MTKKIRSASLLIGKVINQELSDIVHIYPCIAPNGTVGNFAIYKRLSLSTENTKDIYNVNETTDVAIVAVSQNYEESLKLATNVKFYLEHLRGNYKTSKDEEINISDCTMVDASEDYNNDAYVQTMVFRFMLYNEPEYMKQNG